MIKSSPVSLALVAFAVVSTFGCAGRRPDVTLEVEREVVESKPVITALELDPTGELDTRDGGHEVHVALTGDPGLQATFDVTGRLKQQPMTEGPLGHYAGKFNVAQGEAGDLQIEATLRDPSSGVSERKSLAGGLKLYRSERPPPPGDCPRELADELDRKLRGIVVHYPLDTYELSDDARVQIAALKETLLDARYAACPIQVDGHSDEIGSEEYNSTLSRHRALEVAWFLESGLGVPAQRLKVEYYGESQPVTPGLEHAAVNRRVELRTVRD